MNLQNMSLSELKKLPLDVRKSYMQYWIRHQEVTKQNNAKNNFLDFVNDVARIYSRSSPQDCCKEV